MSRVVSTILAVLALFAIGLSPATAASPTRGTAASVTTARWFDLCDRGITCSSVFHRSRGIHRRLVVNCGQYGDPRNRSIYLSMSESSRTRGTNCDAASDPDQRRVNAVWVPRGLDVAFCEWHFANSCVWRTWENESGWAHIRSNRVHAGLFLVRNGVAY